MAVKTTQEELDTWLATLPAETRAELDQVPIDSCCTMKTQPVAHYLVHGYSHNRETGDVALTLIHGKDSISPGMMVGGIRAAEVEPCGCGKWEYPTEEQMKLMHEHIEILHKAQDLGGYPERVRRIQAQRKR